MPVTRQLGYGFAGALGEPLGIPNGVLGVGGISIVITRRCVYVYVCICSNDIRISSFRALVAGCFCSSCRRPVPSCESRLGIEGLCCRGRGRLRMPRVIL